MKAAGFAIEYGPTDEPWGVRRFYVRDPFGRPEGYINNQASVGVTKMAFFGRLFLFKSLHLLTVINDLMPI